jgi:hypothetical protein
MRQFCLLAQLSASRPSFEVKEVTPCSASSTLTPSPTDPAPDWPGGYFCDCHGSKCDLAGRMFKEVSAPCKLPVPPHHVRLARPTLGKQLTQAPERPGISETNPCACAHIRILI